MPVQPFKVAKRMLPTGEVERRALELRVRVAQKRSGVERPRPNALERYCPHTPTPKQQEFLDLTCREALYGGAAAGGKSDALLMAALQYVHVPGYAAILFRRTFADLSLPGALLERAEGWLGGTDARWSESRKSWSFPTGAEPATLTFGYLENLGDEQRYKSAEFQFIGWDELTTFPEKPYRFLFSRLRRAAGSSIPLRVRAASNPGGIGHEWVKQRFLVEGPAAGRVFVGARLDDNPFVDRDEYVESLSELDLLDLEQLLNGDWTARRAGGKFLREWFHEVERVPPGAQWVRRWDLAATEPKPGRDPDYTVGVLMAEWEGRYYIADVVRLRAAPGEVEDMVRRTAERDGREVRIRMEREPGATGVIVIDHYAREVLQGYDFDGVPSSGNKELRANVLSSAASKGNVAVLPGAWHSAFLDEAEAFPLGPHDDQIDAASGAAQDLVDGGVGSFGQGDGVKGEGWGIGGERSRRPEDLPELRGHRIGEAAGGVWRSTF